jgi:polar amino acid transport system permease protein
MALNKRTQKRLRRYAVYAITLVVVGFIAMSADWERIGDQFFNPEIFVEQFWDIITVAAWHTLVFTVFGFTGGLLLGLLLALMRLSDIRPYRWFASVYIEVFRGVPMLVTLLIIGFGIPIAFNGTKVPFTYGPGSLALAIVSAAYMAESIRAGIEAVPKGQAEAARSLGMSEGRAMLSIVIPQAFRIILPPLTNELVLLLKDTSLISVLGVTASTIELTKFARNEAQDTLNSTPYIAAAMVYLCMTIPLTRVAAYLEHRSRRAK